MNVTEIAALPAGPELDDLIDQQVMGHAAGELCHGDLMDHDGMAECMECAFRSNSFGPVPHKREAPAYSTDWGAAGLVVRAMRTRQYWFSLVDNSLDATGHTTYKGVEAGFDHRTDGGGEAEADTDALAICWAALLALNARRGEWLKLPIDKP